MKSEILWNKLIEEYDNQYHAIMDWKLGYSVVEEMLGDIKEKKILDYGCGSGKFSRKLRDLGASITAVDVSENAIEKALQKDTANIDYRIIKNDDISFLKQKSIDHAVSTFVLCTIQNENQIKNITEQIYQKLKQNGYFIILEPHPNSLNYEYISMKRKKPKELKAGAPIEVQLTGMDKTFCDYWRPIEDYKRILTESGFEVDTIKEPIIEDDNEFWKDEKIQSPFLIIRAKKNKKK